MSSKTYPVRAAFFGRRKTHALRAVALALVLTVVYSIPAVVIRLGTLPDWYRPNVYLAVVGASTLGSAAVHGYYNSGLLVSWLVAGVQFTPIGLAFTATSTAVGDPSVAFSLGLLVLVLGAYGAVVGTVGFLAGVGLRETVGTSREVVE